MPTLHTVPGRLAHLWEDLRGSLWFVPGLMAFGAIATALLMLWLDGWWAPAWAVESGWIYSRSASGARALLSTVATSMITIAGLTFSILIIALQLASSQFGPRVLRNYMRDRGSQFVLGTFIATFLYCVMVMRTIGDVEGQEPRLSVTLGVVLAIASLAVLIYFLHHSAASIHAPNVIIAAAKELDHTINRMYPDTLGEGAACEEPPPRPSDGKAIAAHRAGYVQRVDANALFRSAEQHELLLHVVRRPGDFVLRDDPLVIASPAVSLTHEVGAQVASAFIIGGHRTAEQDVEFCFEQIVQITLRALSPAYNDPLTAAACVEHLGAAISHLLQRREPPARRADRQGRVRVIAPAMPIARIIDLTLTPIADAARGSTIVSRQLARMLDTTSRRATTAATREALATTARFILQEIGAVASLHARDEIRAQAEAALARLELR